MKTNGKWVADELYNENDNLVARIKYFVGAKVAAFADSDITIISYQGDDPKFRSFVEAKCVDLDLLKEVDENYYIDDGCYSVGPFDSLKQVVLHIHQHFYNVKNLVINHAGKHWLLVEEEKDGELHSKLIPWMP